jgi:hypothetical protein
MKNYFIYIEECLQSLTDGACCVVYSTVIYRSRNSCTLKGDTLHCLSEKEPSFFFFFFVLYGVSSANCLFQVMFFVYIALCTKLQRVKE